MAERAPGRRGAVPTTDRAVPGRRATGRARRSAAALLALAALGAAPLAARAVGGVELSEVDREPPTIALERLDGAPLDPDALAGRPQIVNFWATWCAPCVEELPAMNAAWAALEGEGVGMLAINAGEARETVEAFLDRVPVDFPVALGDAARTLPDWSVRVLPTTLVLDASGRVVYEALGPRDWDDEALLDRVRALVAD